MSAGTAQIYGLDGLLVLFHDSVAFHVDAASGADVENTVFVGS